MKNLRQEMARYYSRIRIDDIFKNQQFVSLQQKASEAVNKYIAEHPDDKGCLVKAYQTEIIAELFEPTVFRHSPFFWEMGLRPAENWGTPNPCSPGSSLFYTKFVGEVLKRPEEDKLNYFRAHSPTSPLNVFSLHGGGFDCDHHCLGYTKLLDVGVNGILTEIAQRRARGGDAEQMAFLESCQRSSKAVLRVAQRFAEKADAMLVGETDEQAKKFLQMVSETARWVPANKPRTFYEGLAMMWFMREAVASLESVGVSVVGHMDRQLIGLYRGDIEAGRLTEAEARDLLARWMLPTDVKFHAEDNKWPETSTCMELGGCDADGNVIFNELTCMFIEVHGEHRLLSPKLNCRYSADSPKEYLELMSSELLDGRNNFAFLNDDVLIPACMRAGKTERESRLYVNGGCQETIVEGVEHSAGAYYYFNMAQVLDLTLQEPCYEGKRRAEYDEYVPTVIEQADSFDTYLEKFMASLENTASLGAKWARGSCGDWGEVNPCPLFSGGITGCIEKAKDYSQGGAKYNPSGIAIVGFGTMVDSLYAIKKAVFEEGWCSLDQLREAIRCNWAGHEQLRSRFIALPKFGHGVSEVDELAGKLADRLSRFAATLENERGEHFQASMFVYYAFVNMGQFTRATPDGRCDGDMLSQGVSPGRVRSPQSITQVFNSLGKIDFTGYPGNAVLDVQLPAVGKVSASTLAAVLRTFAQAGGATIQCNCASVEDMRDAKAHPEKHGDLIVRISGLSAHFVALEDSVQNEIIDRAVFAGLGG